MYNNSDVSTVVALRVYSSADQLGTLLAAFGSQNQLYFLER